MPKPRLTTLRLEHRPDQPVATLLLNRPDRLNALSRELLREIPIACRWLDETVAIKAVVVRGSGRAFSAGFDLDDFTTMDQGSPRDTADLGRLAAEALTDVRPLTIAAVHGHCVGGGLVLAAACDLRLAADDVRFSIPEVDLGIPLAWGGIPRLVRELGPAITKELVLTCRPFGADEALGLRLPQPRRAGRRTGSGCRRTRRRACVQTDVLTAGDEDPRQRRDERDRRGRTQRQRRRHARRRPPGPGVARHQPRLPAGPPQVAEPGSADVGRQ